VAIEEQQSGGEPAILLWPSLSCLRAEVVVA
jgi:hypothetical protein